MTFSWEQRNAKELCNIGTGKSNTQDQIEDGIYPFFIRSDVPVKSNKFLYDCEAVITIGDGNIGKVFHYVNGKFDLHQRCYKITDFQFVTGKYFFYFFSTHFYERAMKMTAKATVDSVRLEMIADMEIRYPHHTTEQVAIANFFSNLDRLITLHQRKDILIRTRKFLKIHFQKKIAWEQRKLEMLASFSKGSGYSKNDILPAGTPIILYGRLYTKYETNISVVDTFADAKAGSVYSRGGEVIVPASGETAEDISIASVVERKGVILGGDLNIITPNTGLNPTFLALTITYGNAHNDLSRFAQGKSVVHLHNSDLKVADIPYPSEKEQQKIGMFFRGLDQLITLHQREQIFDEL